jgi:hypothetical protein
MASVVDSKTDVGQPGKNVTLEDDNKVSALARGCDYCLTTRLIIFRKMGSLQLQDHN